MYKITAFANLLGISVRMLHHYDKIGLLVPKSITSKGYRLYDDSNLEKAQQILFFKELDFSLCEIATILNDNTYTKEDALRMQKNLLTLKKERIHKMICFIDTLLETPGEIMKEQLQEALQNDALDNTKLEYAQEAKERWGGNDSYKESQNRMANYSPEDIQNITNKQANIYKELAAVMHEGIESKAVQDKVHEARLFISKYWYECSVEMFASLGEMYIADERFTKNIDKAGVGVAAFLSKAIEYYALHSTK